MTAKFAYLSQGKLYHLNDDNTVEEIESQYGKEVLERDVRLQERQGWKSQGQEGALSAGFSLWGNQVPNTPERIAINALAWDTLGKRLFYVLNTNMTGGLFSYDYTKKRELRIFHKTGFGVYDLDFNKSNNLFAASLRYENGMSNIAVFDADGRGQKTLTEGDSMDMSPAWSAAKADTLVYHSAGIARNQHGFQVGLGPFCIEELDIDNKKVTTLADNENYDYLQPKVLGNGDLLYIRRPYEVPGTVSPFHILTDIVMFPVRLFSAFIHFLNFFSMIFSGRPLASHQGSVPGSENNQEMMLWGRIINVEKMMKANKSGNEALVPKNWELVKKDSGGNETVIAENVLSFDTDIDDHIYFTNGSTVYRLKPDGSSEKVFKKSLIEKLLVLD